LEEGIFLETTDHSILPPRRFSSFSFRVRRETARRMDDDDDDSLFFTSLNVRFTKHVFEALRFVLLVIVGSTTRARALFLLTEFSLRRFFIVLGKGVTEINTTKYTLSLA
jgi:hypothetical protein